MTRRSKTDRRGRGHERGVPHLSNKSICAVRAVRLWLRASGITRGPLFRTFSMQNELQRTRIDPRDVARALQRVTGTRLKGDFAAHSLRSGYITSAARAGVTVPAIMGHTGHRSSDIVISYVKRAKILEESGLTQIVSAAPKSRKSRRRDV
jgi:integrase